MKAIYVETIEVTDPDSGLQVSVDIFKDPESGGMFGIDESFLEQVDNKVQSPFNAQTTLELEEDFTSARKQELCSGPDFVKPGES